MSRLVTQRQLADEITALLAEDGTAPVVLALDGRCGSGKTTLAAALQQQFPHSIVLHTDDYYLPPAQRVPGWQQIPCANMDLTRLRAEALAPLCAGQAALYRAYSCRQGQYLTPQCLQPQPLVIVEGSYSQHPALADCYTRKIFVTCSKAEQIRRLRLREGGRYENFVRQWIPLEEAYFARYEIEAGAGAVLDTSAE